MVRSGLDPAAREEMIRRAWYAHDARWFAAVAAECGIEVANRLNRAAVRAVGQVEAGRLARALGMAPTQDIDAFLDLLRAGIGLYVAPPLMQVSIGKVDARSYEVAFDECFVSTNVEKAGISAVYECAVWDRLQGYHEALGQSLAEGQLPATTCVKAQGRECRRVLRIEESGRGG
ncbi:MAG: hypothetical protein Kow0010_18470 [Dehalococcoidia bacterium]